MPDLTRAGNPYAAPDAMRGIPDPCAAYTGAVFGLHGRVGRARFAVYAVLPTGALLALVAALSLFARPLAVWIALLAVLSHPAMVAVRRLDDLDRSRWWSLLLAVPGVNVLLVGYLLCAPGNPEANLRGPAPTDSIGMLVKAAWLACAVPPLVILVVYLLVTFKLPV